MRLNGLAITVLVLLLNHQSPIIYDYNPRLTSIMAVYLYIVRVEETIKTCSRADPKNAASYYKVYETYHNKMARIVTQIGFLVGQEARFKGVDKGTLLDSVGRRVDIVAREIEQKAEINTTEFMESCHSLPKAAAAKIGPFEPLAQRFPQEMKIIQRSEDMVTPP